MADPTPDWRLGATMDQLEQSGRLALKLGEKQIALFIHDGAVHACNNRCPHEGYPLVEGTLGADCVLTCQWHNWKFDLRSGANQYGGDALRIYPVKVEDGAIWVDTGDPPRQQRIDHALAQLDSAVADNDTPRIARELARLAQAGAPAELALAGAIAHTHERLRDGMTHAYAAAEAWFALRDSLVDDAERLACATEALSYIADDSLREPLCPDGTGALPWDEVHFLAAVEAQDEARAARLLHGACDASLAFEAIEPTLAAAALAHYNDFGHSLIYLHHLRGLVLRLGTAAMLGLLLAWSRSLVRATREDLLPDFRAYAPALSSWRPGAAARAAAIDASAFVGQSVRQCLAATAASAGGDPLATREALMAAAALNLLRFDERHQQRSDNKVGEAIGWLDFTHALTFGHAVRLLCTRHPALWPQGLLQLSMFVGRNSDFLDPQTSAVTALQRWHVDDPAAFERRCTAVLLDHGIGVPIFAAHLLKTWCAVQGEIALGVSAELTATLRAAANRLFASRLKQRHVLRLARQMLAFVERED